MLMEEIRSPKGVKEGGPEKLGKDGVQNQVKRLFSSIVMRENEELLMQLYGNLKILWKTVQKFHFLCKVG